MAQQETISLNEWCKDTGFNQYLEQLKEMEFETINDLFILSGDDLNDVCTELGLKFGKKSKFLNAIKDGKKKHGEKDDEKDEEKNNGNPNREIFPDGINIVPFTKQEYQLPDGGKGFAAHNVSILTTVRDKLFSFRGKENVKPGTGAHMEKSKCAPEKLFCSPKHKIILVCGETGVGKSTLINSMMNYIYDVQYSDKFRLKLIHEKKSENGNSVTQHISSYKIKEPKGGNINYDLTIIDTPGFGDTKGKEKDKQIAEEFKYIMDNVVTQINGICFVVRSSATRLTESQKYVFNSILNLWAKDISDNIFILMTFADGKNPPKCIETLDADDVLKSVRKRIPINNEAFADDPLNENFDGKDIFGKLLWDKSIKCLKQFFDELDNVKPQSTEKSTKVLRQATIIEAKIYSMSSKLDYISREQEEVKRQKQVIKKYERKINAGEEVIYDVKKQVWEQIKVNEWMTNCNTAEKTCHAHCWALTPYFCNVMSWGGKCEICGYGSGDHVVEKYEWGYVTKTVKKSTWDDNQSLKDSFDKATKNKQRAANHLKRLEDELKKYEAAATNQLAMILNLQNELERIALRPKFTTIGEYIDQAIENEKKSPNRRDSAAKIKCLQNLKQKKGEIEEIRKRKNVNDISKEDMMMLVN